MKVNGIDVRKYNAKQLTVEVQPPQSAIKTEWNAKKYLPDVFEENPTFGTLKISVYFYGKDRNDILEKASEFLRNFMKETTIELDGYKNKFVAYMTANSLNKLRVKNRSTLEVMCDGYFLGKRIEKEFENIKSFQIETVGTRTSPVVLTIKVMRNVTELKITGFEEEITIKDISQSEIITINGENGTILSNEKNKFNDAEMWDFPFLVPKKTYEITMSENCNVKIGYSPRYL